MSDTNINININAKDNYSSALAGLQGQLSGIGNAAETIGRGFRTAGREIGQIGSGMALLGASITAPLMLAYSNAGKFSAEINAQQFAMKKQWDEISVSIGQSMVPEMKKLLDTVTNMVKAWNSVTQAQRDHIIQTALVAGGYLLWGGIAVKAFGEALRVTGDLLLLTGKLFQGISALSGAMIFLAGTEVTVSNGCLLIANSASKAAASVVAISFPMIAAYGAVLLLIAAMVKWQAVSDTVVSAAEVLWKGFWSILVAIKLAFTGLGEVVVDALEGIVAALAKIPGPQQALLTSFKNGLDAARLSMQGLANQDIKGLGDQFNSVSTIIKTGQGDWSAATDGWRLNITKAAAAVKDFGASSADAFNKAMASFKALSNAAGSGSGSLGGNGNASTGFWNGFQMGILQTSQKMFDFFSQGKAMATNFETSLTSTFSSFFNDAFTGQLKKAQAYFAQFGQAIVKMFADMIAQMIVRWILFGTITGGISGSGSAMGGLFGAFGGKWHDGGTVPKYHFGGITPIIAHNGLAVDEVPAILQTGEGVLSRKGMSNLAALNSGSGVNGAGGIQVNPTVVIQAWDTSDVMRNMQLIKNAVGQDLINNGQLRTLIKQYGN